MDRFELAAQGATDGLWDWDLTTNRIHFSKLRGSMLGSEESILLHNPEEWFNRIHPEDLGQVQHEIRSHLENGSNQFRIQHRILHKDNLYRWMSCQGIITRNKKGKAIRIAGSYSFMTGEKVVDDLTGLPNRIPLLNRLTRCLETMREQRGSLFAVLVMDLELPENIVACLESKDRNLLIVTAAHRLETWLRAAGTISSAGRDHVVARSEGERFIILIDGLNDGSESKIIAERLLREISVPFALNGRDVFISASIGIAISATGYQTAQEVLHDAEAALYRSRLLGKGRCEVFDSAILKSPKVEAEVEGIENPGQLNRVRSLDREYGQGFLFSEAISKNKVELLLKKYFALADTHTKRETTTDEGDIKHLSDRIESLILPLVEPGLNHSKIKKRKGKFRVFMMLIIAGSAAIISLFSIGLLDSFKTKIPIAPAKEMQIPISEDVKPELPVDTLKTATNKNPLPVYESPTVHDFKTKTPISSVKKIQTPISEDVKPELPVDTPRTGKSKKPLLAFEFPIAHDHFIGNCRGTLKVTHTALAYISDKKKCSFDLNYNDITFSLDKDRLEIKTKSKIYHFKSINSSTEEENRSKIQNIFERISQARS